MLTKKIIAFLILLPGVAYSQLKCIDSFENKSFYNERFKYITEGLLPPLISNDSSVIYSAQGHLIKKNKSNSIEWVKNTSFFSSAQFKSSDNGIVGVFNNQPGSAASERRGFFKLSASGNLLWAKEFKISLDEFNNYGYLANVKKGYDDDIIVCDAVSNKISLTILNNDASVIKLARNFLVSLPDGQSLTNGHIAVGNNSLYIIATTQKYEFTATQIIRYNLLLMKLNYTTGNIEKTNYLHFNDELSMASPPPGQNIILQGMLSEYFASQMVNDTYLYISGRKSYLGIDNNRFFSIKLDTNLTMIKNTIYEAPASHKYHSAYPTTTPSIDKNGNTLFAILKDSINTSGTSNSCYYFLTNNNLDVIAEKHLNIAEAGLNSRGYSLNAVPIFKLNDNAEIVFHTNSSEADSLLHIVEINSNIMDAPCRGEDVSYITTKEPGITQLTTSGFTNINGVSINITPYNLNLQNANVEERKFCTQKSICDTIKIIGQSKFCLPLDTSAFTLIKNPQCLRRIIWEVDTTALRIISSPADTIIKVKFLRPYSGYIKARFENCVLSDSIFIEVSQPMAKLFAGRDTMLCPGKQLVLKATNGFKSYIWNNGVTTSSAIATTEGIYYVTATDSCDNIFTDSIKVDTAPEFAITYEKTICQFDTAYLILNNRFTNYTWQPFDKGIISSGQLKLYPGVTNIYRINAEAFTGCILTDTVKIEVKNCPIYFYVPNAFTPNNDGNNDLFKPLISGNIIKYQFNIYNRFGQIIFSSSDINKGWNGKIKGVAQNTGSFAWTCSYQFSNQSPISKKGMVTLLR